MKKFYSAMLLMLMCCVIILTGCSGGAKLNYPETTAQVTGNGGMAVVKDDYLYYVNGYVDISTYSNFKVDNVPGKEVRGAIYKTKLDNGKLQKDKDGFLLNTKPIVPQVVGFDNGGFYIIGDYLYFLSPLMENDKSTTLLKKGFIEVCRVKLDGTGKQRVYKTANAITDINWAVYNMDGSDVVVMVDGTNLVSITPSGKKFNVKTMATKVEKAMLLEQHNYTHGINGLTGYQQNVYYTRKPHESESVKNVLASVKIGTSNENILYSDKDITYDIVAIKNNNLYFTEEGSVTNHLKLRTLKTPSAHQTVLTIPFTDVVVLDNNYNSSGKTVVASTTSNNNQYKLTKFENGGTTFKLIYQSSKEFTIVHCSGAYLYIQQEGHIYRLDVTKDSSQKAVQLTNPTKTYFAANPSLIDFDNANSFLFIFANYKSEDGTENYYLNIINRLEQQSEDFTSKFVGKFKDNERPAQPEQPEATEEDPEPDYIPWID